MLVIITFSILISAHLVLSKPEVVLTKPYTLKLVASLPITGNIFPLGNVCTESANIAVEMANNRSDILPDYNIVLDIIDDQCNAAVGLDRSIEPFFLNENRVYDVVNGGNYSFGRIGQFQYPERLNFVHGSATKLHIPPILAGSVCSGVCMLLANMMPTFNKIQYAGVGCNSIAMDDEQRYPNTYRTWSFAQFADATTSFINQMHWDQVAVISDSITFNIQTLQRFLILSAAQNISVGAVEIFVSDPTEALRRIQAANQRIIIAICYPDTCPKIACVVSVSFFSCFEKHAFKIYIFRHTV